MTVQMSIPNSTVMFDDGVYPSRLDSELSLSNVKKQVCVVMPAPSGSDIGLETAFSVPENYSADPVLVIRGVIDGTPGNILAFGAQQNNLEDMEAIDVAYESEDTANNSTWTGYADEELYEETISLTPATDYLAGELVFLRFYRDDSVDTTTWNFLLLDLLFQYTEL